MTTATPATPFLAAAHDAVLEDWGPLPEATGKPMRTSGSTLWADGDQEAGIWSAPRGRPGGSWRATSSCTSCPAG